MVSSFFRDCQSLFKARLSRYVSFWVFLSILVIEAIILIPSYRREEQDLLRQLEDVATAKINAIALLTQQQMSQTELQNKIETITADSPVVAGLALYDSQGNLVKITGNAPNLTPVSLQGQAMIRRQRSPGGQWYDVAWSKQSLGINYTLIIRHDASHIQQQLYWYIARIAGLVLIIVFFVTLSTMIVLGMVIITPILRLRDDLKIAGQALSQDQLHCNFYSLKYQQNNELGEVMQAFTEMFDRVASEIARRKEADQQVRREQEKAETLLLNILPKAIADTLKQGKNNIAQGFPKVTILFADIVHFTEISAQISPQELVSLLNQVFSVFDQLTDAYGLEKIKTIGDNYMVAGGLPNPNPNHALAVAEMAIAMQQAIQQIKCKNGHSLQLRIGMNTGSVVAGVIGTKKFIYDLWGDAVNVASRMESHGVPGKIQVTENTYECLKAEYHFEKRGSIFVKGRGEMVTYFLLGKKQMKRKQS
ncbi:MAG: adenylate/guanylate cyclase domain-containing protein [Kamptonema sp. SIO4C4]|nr:adenylate/guanylate cyclase domain-containing protein [Kamptonema sp. SIO4C4]